MKEYDFYIVPTPIGNLGDITLRAIEVLRSVDVIACEDSRVTQKLLNHFDIKTKCISYHKFNEKERIDKFFELLNDGKKIALVSDAGTPLICDPGAVIIDELRESGFRITALPGANAVVTFLSQIPRADEKFTFVGFLPKTQSQIEGIVNKYKYSDIVFYESPNRIMKTLEFIKGVRPDCHVAIGRELTKVFEEIVTDEISKIIEYFNSGMIKGEIVGMVYRKQAENTLIDLDDKIKTLQDKNFKAKDISIILSSLFDINKNDVYKRVLEL